MREATEEPAEETAALSVVVEIPCCRFGRELRLLKPDEFKRVFESAVKVSTRYLTILGRANGAGSTRLGLAISKKSVKRAVDRNRIKRQVRESFRLHQVQLAGIDIVVMAKSGVADWEWSELRTTLDNKWRELRKRCKSC